VIEEHYFANISFENEDGRFEYLGADNSELLYKYLKDKKYIDGKGKIQDNLRLDIRDNTFQVPLGFEHLHDQITSVIKKIAGNLNIKNANDKRVVSLNKEILLGEDFRELWERIKYKTTYNVQFDAQKLIEECARKIADELTVGKIKYLYSKAKNRITKVGVEIDTDSISEKSLDVEIIDYELPDIITYLQNETNLTRRDIVDILIKSKKLESFKNNPQKFIDGAIKIIKKTMSVFIVDGIKYEKIGDDFYYAQECFEDKELYGYLNKNMIENREGKSIYDYTIYDSDIEKGFAESFNKSDEVKLFAKLPSWFKISTPLGGYNPDWAVLIEKDNKERLYFVVESKGSLFGEDLRDTEQAKIDCGKKHFEAIATDVGFVKSNGFEHLREHINR
ncbi:MAG: type III restriction endonuclease subunit R, partial [Sulfuricurvum sp.]